MLTEDDLNRISKHFSEGSRKELLKRLRKYKGDGGIAEAIRWVQDQYTTYADELRQRGRRDLQAKVEALDGKINDLTNAEKQLNENRWRSIEELFQPSKDDFDT